MFGRLDHFDHDSPPRRPSPPASLSRSPSVGKPLKANHFRACDNGPGIIYLNAHRAASGKTVEIATFANSLATLHNVNAKAVFNPMIFLLQLIPFQDPRLNAQKLRQHECG